MAVGAVGAARQLRVALDVQHLFRPAHPNDRGAIFRTSRGTLASEGELALGYTAAARRELERNNALVFTNHPLTVANKTPHLVGPYSRRALDAELLEADVYLACHVNAGAGKYARCSSDGWRRGPTLASSIGQAISSEFPMVVTYHQVVALRRGDRGWPCIGLVRQPCTAVLLEPFFGDNPRHLAAIGSPAGLERLGRAVASAVLRWWELTT